MSLRFRAPGVRLSAAALLARVLPEATAAERQALATAGALRSARLGEKGWAAGEPLADPQAEIRPGSPWLLEAPAREPASCRGAVLQGLAPRLAFVEGELPGGVRFAELELRGGVARYRLTAAAPGAVLEGAAAAEALAAAGAPLLGDRLRGGRVVAGGLALGGEDAALAWPEEPVFAPDLESGDPEAELRVSRETRRALSRGHPWVLRDPETGDTASWRPGARVRLAGGVEVRLEPAGPVAARVWSRGRAASLEARVAAALDRRRALLGQARDPAGSDAFRLIHGEADGLPGIQLDRLGSVLRLVVSARCAEPLVPALVAAVDARLADARGGEPRWVSAVCLRGPPRGRFRGVVALAGPEPELDPEGRLFVRERGLRFAVDPGLRDPSRPRPGVGLFLDQRENRARASARVRPGGRYLNLFAHTGAFSVALLAAGAGEVVSVDLSGAYLRWLEANLAANGLAGSAAHRAVRSDGRRFLERLGGRERFDGIVLDPPTAAAAGRHFWSVRRDLEPLARDALERLAPGGWLLLSRNDRRAKDAWARELARAGGVKARPAPPGPDFPALEGFPEGDPFRAWLFTRP